MQNVLFSESFGQFHVNALTSLAYSRESNRFVTGSLDRTARVWDPTRRECFAAYEGHTDAVGSAGKNRPLSQARADSVKAYLVKNGVAEARLKTLGLGSDKPVASNETPIGRAQNRRVELVKQ